MNKKRYQEEYEEGSNLLWPSEEEDKITRKFYRDLSHLSKKTIHKKKYRLLKIRRWGRPCIRYYNSDLRK